MTHQIPRERLVVVAAHCQGKQKYDRAAANRVARRQGRKGVNVRPYQCKVCDKWHIGR